LGNGLAERFVLTVKRGLKTALSEESNLKYSLDRFLLAYRNAPHSTTGQSPAELMLGRPLRTRLDTIKPDISSKFPEVHNPQTSRQLSIGSHVWVRCYLSADKWKQGVITDRLGPLCYIVSVDGRKWKRHIDQLKVRILGTNFDCDSAHIPGQRPQSLLPRPLSDLPCRLPSREISPSQQPVSPQVSVLPSQMDNTPVVAQPKPYVSTPKLASTPTLLRRSSRVSNPPKRLDL